MRHLLQRLVRSSVIQSRAAHYSIASSTRAPNRNTPAHLNRPHHATGASLLLKPASQQNRYSSSGQQISHLAHVGDQGHESGAHLFELRQSRTHKQTGRSATQQTYSSHGNSQDIIDVQPTGMHTQGQANIHLGVTSWQPALQASQEVQTSMNAVHQLVAEMQPSSAGHDAGSSPLPAATPQEGMLTPAVEDQAEIDKPYAASAPSMLNQQSEFVPAGVLSVDSQQSQAVLIGTLLHQQHVMAASLQQMSDDMHAMRQLFVSESEVMKGSTVGKIRLKPLK